MIQKRYGRYPARTGVFICCRNQKARNLRGLVYIAIPILIVAGIMGHGLKKDLYPLFHAGEEKKTAGAGQARYILGKGNK